MYRAAITILSILLFVLLLITGTFLFLFSSTGDETFKPYLKQMIEEKSGLPVEVKTYRLRAGKLELDLLVDGHLHLQTTARYDLFSRTFEGVYRVRADDFRYEEIFLKEADIRGRYKGVAEDIFIQGKGTLLNAPASYQLRLIDTLPQQIVVNAKDLPLQELLKLASQPPLAKGKVDLSVDMPQIGEEGAKGKAHLVVKDALFDRILIKKQYGMDVPKGSLLTAQADAMLAGKKILFDATGNSSLFSFALKQGRYQLDGGRLKGSYVADVKEMRLFSRNRLHGPFRIVGNIEGQGEALKITGESRSLGGVLQFQKAQKTTLVLKALSLSKVLRFTGQPAYAQGVLNGEVLLDDPAGEKGSYRIDLEKGALNAKVIRKRLGYRLPEKNRIRLHSAGRIDGGKLKADVVLVSTVADVRLKTLAYDLKAGTLKTPYRVTIHDLERLTVGDRPRKGKAVVIEGDLAYTQTLSLKGEVKGLGKRTVFSYNGTRAEVDAAGVYLGRILALAGMPRYLDGRVDAEVKMTDIGQQNGTFSLDAKSLQTVPEQMKKLLGKPVKMKIAVSAKGEMKHHKAYADATVKMPLGSLKLSNAVSDLRHQTFTAKYHMDIPNLKKLAQVSDIRLYGALALDGMVTFNKVLKVTGKTRSLGGSVAYTLVGNRFHATVTSVPLPNILKLAGYPQSFLGSVSGKADYHLQTRKGVVNLKIASFQIKPSDLTRMLAPVLGKDPARIIFKTTTFHARINKDIVTYRLLAKGSHSAIEITDGWVNQKSRQQKAKLKFVYGKYTVYGTIRGTTEHPKIYLDTSKLIKEKLEKKLEKKWGKEAGVLLKGLGL
jgi:hypothetical protein